MIDRYQDRVNPGLESSVHSFIHFLPTLFIHKGQLGLGWVSGDTLGAGDGGETETTDGAEGLKVKPTCALTWT